jgi:hypothetical protein
MLHIDVFGVIVYAKKKENDELKTFGRKLEFGQGLTVIAGDNTSGKSSLVKCLYYALGLEQLIEGIQGLNAMDKSVYSRFITKKEGAVEVWTVDNSYVYIQLTNSKGKSITLRRIIIKPGIVNEDGIMEVYDSPLSKIKEYGVKAKEYFIHTQGNHEAKNGFFRYLSEFSELPIVNVEANSQSGYSPLYMQMVYSACFIEQKRGWSGFLATVRSFNVYYYKRRIIEYLLGISSETNYDKLRYLSERNKELGRNWTDSVVKISALLSYNNLFINNLEQSISDQKAKLSKLLVVSRDGNKELEEYLEELAGKIRELQEQRIQMKHTDAPPVVVAKKEQLNNIKAERSLFLLSLDSEKKKIESVECQLETISREIKDIEYQLKTNNIVTGFDLTECPTCHQLLTTGESMNKVFSKKELEQSQLARKNQRNFLETVLLRLKETVVNKEMYRLYFDKLIKEAEEELKLLNWQDSELEARVVENAYRLSSISNEKARLGEVNRQINEILEGLKQIKKEYDDNRGKLKELRDKNAKTDNSAVIGLQRQFRERLDEFGYTSQTDMKQVFIETDEKSSQQLFPVVEERGITEPIISASSASDFIRALWAYYLSLLVKGERHPGFLVMDEPAQHAVKEEDLKTMFNFASSCHRQVILFCSTHTITEEYLLERQKAEEEGKEETIQVKKNLVKDIVEGLNRQGRGVIMNEIEFKSLEKI